MRTLRFLFVVSMVGGIFLLATGLLDLGRIGPDGRIVWDPRLDRAGIARMVQPLVDAPAAAAAPSADSRSASH